jgi:ABC-type phosphate transport system auxiliary subunit
METLKVGMEKLNAAKRELNAELDGEEPTERQQKLYKNMENMKAKYNTTKAKVEALRASALDRPL